MQSEVTVCRHRKSRHAARSGILVDRTWILALSQFLPRCITLCAKVGDQLTGDPVADVSVLAASNLRLRTAMGKALALLGACSTLN